MSAATAQPEPMSLSEQNGLRALDLAFGELLQRLESGLDPAVRWAGVLTSQQLSEGHSCVELAQHAGRRWFDGQVPQLTVAPPLDVWLQKLQASTVVAAPGGLAPLVLDDGRLYLHRYWRFETDIAARLAALLGQAVSVDEARLAEGLRRLFPGDPETQAVDWQQTAAALALLKRFAVITGGPGTGKTYTVTRLLALLLEQAPDDPPRIALAAPTGKARARLSDSIEAALSKGLESASEVIDRIREVARASRTLHGLLGLVPGHADCRYHAAHPLPYEVVVVDEASMIDLPLMARLLAALPESGRLILLGDRDQLPPVEVGNLLGDLCAAAGESGYSEELGERLSRLTGRPIAPSLHVEGPPIRDSLAHLRKPRRFAQGSGIAMLAEGIQRGQFAACEAALREQPDLEWRTLEGDGYEALWAEVVREHILPCLQADAIQQALDRFQAFRILCVLRQGPFGVETINRVIERALNRLTGGRHGQGEWYKGRPVMITRNEPGLGLSNGDIGLAWPDPDAGNALRVYFPREQGAPRSLSPARLPAHETVFAMTVHKSQGSEFGHVHFILPDQPGPLLCRELVYTAVTRAKSRLTLYGSPAVLAAAIGRRMARSSGLHIRLGRS